MPSNVPSEASAHASAMAHHRWANTTAEQRSNTARMLNAARLAKWERKADPDGVMSPAERRDRGRRLHAAWMAENRAKALAAKRRNSAARKAAEGGRNGAA